ncbi:hypothetical protein [Pseudonocardia spinosispora]|uniref:hypothetical protein n=1 Tax=Pseudonocardia spinosispora TaxID=103441 RepID=UPI00048ED67C|nr:hypothetical protein [Pseudonocardia spinosispora]
MARHLPPLLYLTALGFVAAAVALATHLARHDALSGGLAAREARLRGWSHFLANGISIAGGPFIATLGLLVTAAVIARRADRWAPLRDALAAVAVTWVVVAVGKLALGWLGISGPGTTIVVVCCVGWWLLRRHLERGARTALGWLGGAIVLAVGVAQLYLGHSFVAMVVSWLLGAATVGLLAWLKHRLRQRAPGQRP